MGGQAYNQYYSDATGIQAAAQVTQSENDLELGKYDADKEAEAALGVAKYDYDARIAENKTYELTQMEALRVRELEAKLLHKEEMTRIFEVDAPKADAALMMAQAELDDKANDADEIANDYDIDLRKLEDDSAGSYWTG